MKVNVLGTEYEIITGVDEDSDSKLAKRGADGYCDNTTKKIVVAKFEDSDFTQEDLKVYEKDVIRHELVHAFLFESGLDASAEWAVNEEIVDWIALQFPKMAKIFNDLNVMEG